MGCCTAGEMGWLGNDEPDVLRIDLERDLFFRLGSMALVLWKQD